MGDQYSMTRALLIITAEHLPDARAMAKVPPFSLSPACAATLFVPAGSPSGAAPATHYWASGLFTPDQIAALRQLVDSLPWAKCHEYKLDTEPQRPWEVLTGMGLQPLTPPTP
jgi:hypothetical protein